MASAAETFNCTDVFSLQHRHGVTSSATTQWADVIGRGDRRRILVTVPEPRRLPVRLLVDGEPIEFTYSTFDTALPQWTGSVFQALAERWGVRPGWDSYQAKQTSPQLVVQLLNILSDVMDDNVPPPQVTPLADGGMQAEWHNGDHDLEIVVTAGEEPTYYYFNLATKAEEDLDVGSNLSQIRALIGLFK